MINNKDFKESILLFFGLLGLTLVTVKVFGFFGISIGWLYIPGIIFSLIAAIREYTKKQSTKSYMD